ncbi:myb-like protein I [Aplysia californica]|uniref:Myb-like protein I n=1 Tax=Aplysia californica TaxID=6500 RepID=A0ABM0JLB1_APLCA|nr:myb-like protein I [Aplysia californica]
MVRVISQNFSPPRSRHSSGETDWDLAERTKLALSSLGAKRFEPAEYESSSDSFWDSEFDGEHCESHLSEASCEQADINGNDSFEKSDVQSKRKERRRERNKLSAQAYRKRRRNQNAKEQEQLLSLEAENRRLQKLVDTLEKKKEQTRQYLRGCSVSMPDVLTTLGAEGGDKCCGETHRASKESTSAAAAAQLDRCRMTHPRESKTTQHKQYSLSACPPPQQPHEILMPNSSPVNANVAAAAAVKSPSTNSNENSNNVSKFNLFPAQLLTTDSLTKPAQTSQSQIFLQAHALIGTAVTPQDGANFSACAIPAYVAVPVENTTQYFANTNMNCNFQVPRPLESTSGNSPAKNFEDAKLAASSLFNPNTTMCNSPTVMNPVQNITAASPVAVQANTVVGLIQMEMCNNNADNNFTVNMNIDNNGNNNNNCDNNSNNCVRKNPPFPAFNLNLNNCNAEITSTNVEKCTERAARDRNPSELMQCYGTQHDQAMAM